jgi:hypothetical protein
MDPLSSVLLSSPLVTLAGAGAQFTLDPNLMQNPARKAMYIDEVHFIPIDNVEYGSIVKMRLRLNRQNITADFVPVWVSSAVSNISISSNFSVQYNRNINTYIYRPPKPIYVPQYTNLQCDLIVDPDAAGIITGSTTAKFYVIYAGRQIDDVTMPPPAIVEVPWVAKYISPIWTQGNQSAPAQSTANDLVNPFNRPLHVSSMISRTLYGLGDAVFSGPILIQDLITLKMSNSKSAIITRDPTPIGHIFDMFTREAKLDTTLDPNTYFIATLQADMRDVAQAGSALTTIAMHGYRTVTLAEYMH